MTQPIVASEVEAETIEWLWNERIPRGMITTVAGRPDQGKGLFAAHVAAEVSARGEKVIYSAAEDSHGLMTRPRLEAAGADLDNVILWRFRLPLQFGELADLVREHDAALIVMDPFASHLSGGVSRHSDNVRQVTDPLRELVEQSGAACLIIEHALKRVAKGGDVLQVIGGSGSGLPAASRAAYVLGVDPDNADRRILAKAKFNIGPAPKAFAFDVDTEDLDTVGEIPMLVPDDELEAFDAMRLFEGKPGEAKVGRPPDKRAAAAEWLTTYLAEAGGPVKASVVTEDAKQHAMSQKTLRRAAEDMAVVKNPPKGGRGCTWDLPDEVKDLMGLPTGDDDDDTGVMATADETTEGISLEDGLDALLGGDDNDDDDGEGE